MKKSARRAAQLAAQQWRKSATDRNAKLGEELAQVQSRLAGLSTAIAAKHAEADRLEQERTREQVEWNKLASRDGIRQLQAELHQGMRDEDRSGR